MTLLGGSWGIRWSREEVEPPLASWGEVDRGNLGVGNWTEVSRARLVSQSLG